MDILTKLVNWESCFDCHIMAPMRDSFNSRIWFGIACLRLISKYPEDISFDYRISL